MDAAHSGRLYRQVGTVETNTAQQQSMAGCKELICNMEILYAVQQLYGEPAHCPAGSTYHIIESNTSEVLLVLGCVAGGCCNSAWAQETLQQYSIQLQATSERHARVEGCTIRARQPKDCPSPCVLTYHKTQSDSQPHTTKRNTSNLHPLVNMTKHINNYTSTVLLLCGMYAHALVLQASPTLLQLLFTCR